MVEHPAELPNQFAGAARHHAVRDLALLLTVALIPRLLAAWWAVAPARDSMRFIDAALAFENAPFLQAIRQIDVHPAYPLSLLGCRNLFQWLTGIDGAYAWFYAGQTWSIFCYLAFLSASYAAGCQLWNHRLALWGCLAISAVPRQISYSADVLSDSLHAAFWMAAFVCLLRGWQRGRPAWMIAAGVLAALAYWTRVEALLLPMTFASGAVVTQLWPSTRKPWGQWLTLCLAFTIPYLTLAGAYGWTIGNLSARGTAMIVLGEAEAPKTPPSVTPLAPATTSVSDPIAETQTPIESSEQPPSSVQLVTRAFSPQWEGYERVGVGGATAQLFLELGQETRGWILALAVLGTVFRKRSPTQMPEGWFVFLACCGCGVMLVLLKVRAGYIAGRYMTPVLPLFAMYSMTGVEVLRGWATRFPRLFWEANWSDQVWRFARSCTSTGLLVLIAGILCVPAWFKPLHRHRYSHMQAAAWLRENTDPSETVFDPSKSSSFFADRPAWSAVPLAGEQLPVRYAVIDPSMVYRSDKAVYDAIGVVQRRGKVVAQFPRRIGGSEIGIFIFVIHSDSMSHNSREQLR